MRGGAEPFGPRDCQATGGSHALLDRSDGQLCSEPSCARGDLSYWIAARGDRGMAEGARELRSFGAGISQQCLGGRSSSATDRHPVGASIRHCRRCKSCDGCDAVVRATGSEESCGGEIGGRFRPAAARVGRLRNLRSRWAVGISTGSLRAGDCVVRESPTSGSAAQFRRGARTDSHRHRAFDRGSQVEQADHARDRSPGRHHRKTNAHAG